MTARDVLAEIEQRVELARTPLSGPNAWRVRESALDVPRLVAALRAVLDHADKIDHPDHYENTEREETCVECHKRNPFRGGAYWPCAQRKHAESIRTAITDALSGVTTRTDLPGGER